MCILGNLFFKFESFCSFVPVATIIDSKELNFSTNEFPIPPVDPVIKTFLFLNSLFSFLISAIELIEKQLASLIVLLPCQLELFLGLFRYNFLSHLLTYKVNFHAI